MRILPLILCLLFWDQLTAQRKIIPTDTLIIQGDIKENLIFTWRDIDTSKVKYIGDLTLTNQHGEAKNTIKNLKGVLLKPLIDSLKFNIEKPKELNEFYFIFEASDKYKVVFSWNEIFNSPTGNQLYWITEINGKPITELNERILIVSTADLSIGRRYIKGLSKITVRRA